MSGHLSHIIVGCRGRNRGILLSSVVSKIYQNEYVRSELLEDQRERECGFCFSFLPQDLILDGMEAFPSFPCCAGNKRSETRRPSSSQHCFVPKGKGSTQPLAQSPVADGSLFALPSKEPIASASCPVGCIRKALLTQRMFIAGSEESCNLGSRVRVFFPPNSRRKVVNICVRHPKPWRQTGCKYQFKEGQFVILCNSAQLLGSFSFLDELMLLIVVLFVLGPPNLFHKLISLPSSQGAGLDGPWA